MFYELINLKIRNMLQNVRKEDYYLRLFWSYYLKWIFPSKRAEPMDYVICNAWEGKNRSLVPLGRERNSLRGMKKETFNKYLGNSTESIQAWGKGKGGVWKLSFPVTKELWCSTSETAQGERTSIVEESTLGLCLPTSAGPVGKQNHILSKNGLSLKYCEFPDVYVSLYMCLLGSSSFFQTERNNILLII